MNAKVSSSEATSRKTILNLTHHEARSFLLKAESYCSLDFPPYIVFGDLISGVHQVLDGKRLSDFRRSSPREFDDVNYTILHNKDGKYSWRPFELIHPALYVSLVHAITEEGNWQLIRERFRQFALNDKVCCLSLPIVSSSDEKDRAEQVSHWWVGVEQRSIELSLDYDYLLETDITDCYGAIYTHSIAWALHTTDEAKKRENRNNHSLVGNIIDWHIQDMRHGQTNGIPQGSVLMDLIAEMVLGLADLQLSERLKQERIEDFQILRYRDDYRVFVKSPQIGEAIVKLLAETTTALGMKLSPAKTKASNDVVRSAIKGDKLAWAARKQSDRSLQKHLLIIHDHATNYPNSGSLVIALNTYHKRVSRVTSLIESPVPLIAIVADIAFRNPRSYAVCSAILSKLLSFVESNNDRLAIAERIRKKFAQIPNTGHMQIWLQRLTLPLDKDVRYEEAICNVVAGTANRLWNNDWISSQDLRSAIDGTKIVDIATRDGLSPVIPLKEVELFLSKVTEGYYG